MRIIFSFLALAFLFTSCDDGDVITAELDFGDTYNITNCLGDVICHKIKSDPSESLSVVLNTTLEELINTDPDDSNPLLQVLVDFQPAPTVNSFNYRTYNNTVTDAIFCNAIPPSNLGVTNDYSSTGVTSQFYIVLTEDDNDGIPAEFEDIDGDGDFENDDTDGDGLPNYLDADDDGDNVLTANEMPNFSTEFELTQALDTDNDGIPNYLDTDDDGDTVLTINEEGFLDPDLNPSNDISSNGIADYLNDQVNTYNAATTLYRTHTIKQSFQLELILQNIDLPILTQDIVEFGTLTTTSSRTVTPTF